MKNLIVFSGSCGHVTFTMVDDATFETFAAPRMIRTFTGDRMHASPTRTGRSTRAVYVWPLRFTLCQDCARDFADA
jgi:hypothetical protein